MSKVGMGDDKIVQQLITNQREARKDAITLKQLMSSGLSGEQAQGVIDAEKDNKGYWKDQDKLINRKNFTKVGASILALFATIENATKAGFMERFDMASELRQSGLAANINKTNQGFVQLSRMISETGFTFGEAASFTKDFSKTVGVNGVQSTLKFVKSMAHTGDAGGLMSKFAMDFGQVINMSGQYLEGLRTSGQLENRSHMQLRAGMDSFMSNVQATSNVLKISMEEAAELMKNSLGEADRGRLLTLPQEMQDSIRAGLQFAGAGEGPIMDLLAARLGAGSDQGFMLTSEFKQFSGSMIGQELIKYVQQVAPTLENQGDNAFQQQLASTLPQEVQRIIEMMSQQGTRGLVLADDIQSSTLAQINQMAQNMKDAAAGISGGGREDQAAMTWTEQQRQASVLAEGAMTTLMPAFVENLKKLTETNRRFAEQAAQTLTYNKNYLNGLINAATMIERTLTGTATLVMSKTGFGLGWGSNEEIFKEHSAVQDYSQLTSKDSFDIGRNSLNRLTDVLAMSEGFEKKASLLSEKDLLSLSEHLGTIIGDNTTSLWEKLVNWDNGGTTVGTNQRDIIEQNTALYIEELKKQATIVNRLLDALNKN
jgi:CRISPR/Cas system CMR-associated protein Cmr5 small subunit